ncbi:MAG: hypothetical protein L7F78_23750 [Syntrophales bacterium LBB04]|nr:hypothetical protein [Syntrophales bacterium LBB04]
MGLETLSFIGDNGNQNSEAKKAKYIGAMESSIVSAHNRYFQVNSVKKDHEGSAMFASVVNYYTGLSE